MSALRSTARTVIASVLLLGTLAAPGLIAAPAGAASLPPQATSALNWLADELADGGHVLSGSFGPSYGLTADAIMALKLGGVRPTEAAASLSNFQDNIASYFTDIDFGAGNERYAGPLAKALLTVEISGADAQAFGGFDLDAELRARMQTSGAQAGRFSDLSAFGDFSNGFGQALAIMALGRTTGAVPTSAVTFLLAQQCPGGGFRGDYSAGDSCTASGDAGADFTAFAIDALLTTPQATGAQKAVTAATTWLLTQQDASGGVTSGGANNANTTGLAGQALRAVGKTTAADNAAAYISSLQITDAQAGAGPAAGDVGAIAFNLAAHDTALTDGVTTATRDQFHRATAQAVLGLGLPLYGVIPPPPATTTTTTTTIASTTTSTTSTTAASTTSSTGATTSSSAAVTTTTAAASHSALPKTGAEVINLVIIGLALLAIGEVVRRGAREEARRSRS